MVIYCSKIHNTQTKRVSFEFSQNVFNSVKKTVKKVIWTCKFLCRRPRFYHRTSKTQIKERIFKLTLVKSCTFSADNLTYSCFPIWALNLAKLDECKVDIFLWLTEIPDVAWITWSSSIFISMSVNVSDLFALTAPFIH